MSRLRTGHLSVRSGKRVTVHLRAGKPYIAKFKEKRGRYLEFFDHAPESKSNIRTITIYKGE